MNMNATAQMVTTTQVGCGKEKAKPATGEWTVYEDGYGILEWHPKHKDGVGMLCRCHDRMEAEYTVNAHNAALAAERERYSTKSLVGFSREALIQAEREMDQLREQLAAKDAEITRLAWNAKTVEEAVVAEREAGKALMCICRKAVDKCNDVRRQLAYEREQVGILETELLATEKQLAAEREKPDGMKSGGVQQ